MGGFSSTRWGSEWTRQTTDALLKLDVRWLNRIGALRPGAIATPTWSRGEEPSGSIVTIRHRNRPCLTLRYSTQRPGEEWQPVEETVWLETTPCNYGGDRTWFRCPGCDSRRAVLFSVSGRFRCRQCHDLAYSSTREDAMDRAFRRCAELRTNIGGSFGQPVWTIPPKPDGMTWRRYDRIVAQLRIEIDRTTGMSEARIDQLRNEFDKLIAQRKAFRG